ncbi:hypothetical protein GCM10011419_26700 [Vogesella fluminis]|uniref:Uncharacterized protein n=1 Tax=Vogesella fluminis TaxID=1069161 RepID=A0ABQ3HF10_9NEIS|nr:hypothetical protein GCM10011419_26700 [Vogesella fluminis]
MGCHDKAKNKITSQAYVLFELIRGSWDVLVLQKTSFFLTCNQGVASSIPAAGTNKIKGLAHLR